MKLLLLVLNCLTPYRQDTNSLFLTDRLLQLGVNVSFKTIVGDKLSHLASAIRIALGRADIVITMGGLGPTEDDLTRQAVAEALGIRLRRNPGDRGRTLCPLRRPPDTDDGQQRPPGRCAGRLSDS